MKNFFKVITLGLFLALFSAVNVSTTFAQGGDQAEKEALYAKYTENYKGTIAERKVAVEAAKEYIQKFNSEIDKPITDYLKGAIPQLEKGIKDEEEAIRVREAAAADREKIISRYKAFDAALRGEKWDDVYSVGREILAKEPNKLDVILVLGSIGLDESYKTPANKKFNNDTINYARIAIDKIEAGEKTTEFGALRYAYKNKENALGWMNWTIGNLMYFQMDGKEQEALPYLYKASQFNSDVQKLPDIYRAIGRFYLNKVAEQEKIRLAKLTEAENVDTPETLALLAQNRGYAARAIDAYSRAYKFAKDNTKTPKPYTDNLFSKLQDLYKFRYDEDAMKTDAKINSDVALIMNKPMPSPNTPVEPIEVVKPDAENTETTDAAKTDKDKKPTATTGAQRNRTVKDNN